MNGGFGPLSLADGRIPHKRRNALDHWIERLAFRRKDEASIAWTSGTVVRELRRTFGALVIPIDAICDLGTRNHSVRKSGRKEGKRAAGGKVSQLLLWDATANDVEPVGCGQFRSPKSAVNVGRPLRFG
jgi:hypothetical protein